MIVFWGVNLQGSFWIFVVNYYLTTMTGICLAYAVAALVPTMDAANALLPTYVTTCLYFGGLFITGVHEKGFTKPTVTILESTIIHHFPATIITIVRYSST